MSGARSLFSRVRRDGARCAMVGEKTLVRKLVGQGKLLSARRVRLSPLVAAGERWCASKVKLPRKCPGRARDDQGCQRRRRLLPSGSVAVSVASPVLERTPSPSLGSRRQSSTNPAGRRIVADWRAIHDRGVLLLVPPMRSRDMFPERWRAHKLPATATHDAHRRQLADHTHRASAVGRSLSFG